MKKRNNNLISIFIFILTISFGAQKTVHAQFYNGHQMTFGKNRVQYGNFFWRYYRYQKYDSYFYGNGSDMAKRVAKIADKKIAILENYFGHPIEKRIIFLCYNSMSDFRQSNIGYDPEDQGTNTGGVTRIIKNKVFVYYEGSEEKLEQQITKSIAQVIINEILYGGSYRQRLTNSSLMTIPDWFTQGLTDYISQEWNTDIENKVKDGFQSGRYKKFNHLYGDDARTAGHSLWYFTAETYGKDVIPNILYLTRVNRSADNGFLYVIGSTVKDLTPSWTAFFANKFKNSQDNGKAPEKENLILKTKSLRKIQNAKTSPNGQYIAYITNEKGKVKIWLYDTINKKKKKLLRKGNKLEQITDYSYPVLAWHPSGDILSFVTEEQGKVLLYSYFIKTKEIHSRPLINFSKVLSFNYSPNGMMLAISGVKNNQTDIYVMSLTAGISTKVTNDIADDFDPVWVQNAEKILFSSNRLNDSLYNVGTQTPVQKTYDLFLYNYKTGSQLLERITNTKYANETKPIKISENKFISLTNANGIRNRQIIKYDSTISHVDTVVHYRHFSVESPLTNYPENIELYDFGSQQNAFYDVISQNQKSILYKNPYDKNNLQLGTKFTTPFVKKHIAQLVMEENIRKENLKKEQEKQEKLDSLRDNPPTNIPHPDQILFDINNYVFEKDSNNPYYQIYPITDTLTNIESSEKKEILMQHNYLTNFYLDNLSQQVDFGYLNNSYQVFTGQAFYFNQGMNLFFKLGVFDLMEDYKITGGVRIGSLFKNFEYIISAENLKKRLDKQLLYHKQTITQDYTEPLFGFAYSAKVFTNELIYIIKYPFNQVSSVRLSTSARYDKATLQSTEYMSLVEKDQHQFFTGLKAQYVFDNTINPSLNIYEGIRGKAFFEFYQEADQNYTNLFVAGVDFRWYKKIHRSLIFASRFAASSSFGKSKLIYYLGGVDNWYSIPSQQTTMFDQSVEINKQMNYVYQAVATNMRGFPQNARNGTSFAVINNEIRFPIVKYFVNRPVANDFINNFQIVGFTDIGAAWTGTSPYAPENAYNTQTITRNPVSVIVNKNRPPVLVGYGFGIRSRLWGYFFRMDWANGVEYDVIHPKMFYFSLSQDF